MTPFVIEYAPEPASGYAACKLVPEFRLSAKAPKPTPTENPWTYAPVAPVLGPIPSHPAFAPKVAKPKRQLGKAEQAHHDLQPFFKHEVREGIDEPFGTAKPFLPESFLERNAEYHFLVTTQFQELSTLPQQFAANGLYAASLSSSPDDDDDSLEAANVAESHLKTIPFGFGQKGEDVNGFPIYNNLEDIAALLRRLDWERYILACGQAVKVKAVKQDGRTVPISNDKRVTREQLNAFAPKLIAMAQGRSIDDIEDDRGAATYYRLRVLDLMTADEEHDWVHRNKSARAYLDPEGKSPSIEDWHERLTTLLLPDEDEEGAYVTADVPPPPPASGPQELGLHDTYGSRANYEPSDTTLKRWSRTIPRFYAWT